MFLVEGPLAIVEAFDAGAEVLEVFAAPPAPHLETLRSVAGERGVPLTTAGEAVIKALSGTTAPQGAVAVVRTPRSDLGALPARLHLVLVLAAVRDPGNAGTLVRTAVAAGADAIFFSEESVDPYSAKAVRAAAGGLFRVPVVVGPSLEEAASVLKERGLRLIGTDAAAPKDHLSADLGAVALVLGNEAWGIPASFRHLLDDVVAIAMPGPAESLNVAAAGAVLLFEAVAQARRGRLSWDDG